MTHIPVDLNQHLLTPTTNSPLLELVKKGDFLWPTGATCVTQERDGALLWWNAPVITVKNARQKAKPHKGLYPLLGTRNQIAIDYYYEGEQEVVANDWKTAVVTLEQFTGLEN